MGAAGDGFRNRVQYLRCQVSSVLCVDVGGTSTKAGVVSGSGEVQAVSAIATRPDTEQYLANLVAMIRATREATGEKLTRMGVAVAGFLDDNRTHLVYNSNISWLEGFPLRQRLQEQFADLDVQLEVDSNAAAMAEYRFGSGRGSERFLCLTVGTGLGVGVTVDGVPLRFAYGCLGDIGHVIVSRDGPLCTCGGRGCAEILVSAPFLAQQYKKMTRSEDAMTLRDVIAEAENRDPIAISVLEGAGGWLGVAIASMANIFFPDHIAIAGGLSAGGDYVLKPAEKVFREAASVLARSKATFTRATLGSMATLVGAAWPFWEERNANG